MKKVFSVKPILRSLITYAMVLLLVLSAQQLMARAGGAGGGSHFGGSHYGGSGGGGDLSSIVFFLFYLIPFPYNILVFIGLIVLFYIYGKQARQQSVLNQLPTGQPVSNIRGYSKFMANNPDFQEEQFKAKVRTAFYKIQEAWQKKEVSQVRKFISDGMYQRMNVQFKMMDLLDQVNYVENLNLYNVYIDKIESDGPFDIIHTAVHASITDYFRSSRYPELNSGGSEEFVEYWSFIKKRGSQGGDLYSTENCPSCGAPLPADSGEVAQCASCKTLVNTGEYDWVLSEITQADDYISTNPMVTKASNLHDKMIELENENSDISAQVIEDKASNAFLQIETARVVKNPAIMRRFVTDTLYNKLTGIFNSSLEYIYNRLYLSDVTLIGAFQKDGSNTMIVAVKYSYQRVIPREKTIVKIDPVVITDTMVICMTRQVNYSQSQGSLYAHRCPSCGGILGDTPDVTCQFCGTILNSSEYEWIVSDFMTLKEYGSFYALNSGQFVAAMKPDVIDKAMDVRDYAFNNVLIVMACDGNFDIEEREFAVKIARKFGFNTDKIEPMFNMARNGQLSIKMPDDPAKQEKVFRLMEKAATIDGVLDDAEKELLESIKNQYGL